jgi:hypothetical protein
MKKGILKTASVIFINLIFLFSSAGCKKEPGAAPGAAKANLTVETVSGPDIEPCGGFDWKVKFNLNAASAKGGWIVQKIDWNQLVIKCPDVAFIDKKLTYYEAWRVSAGTKGDSERLAGKFNFDDQFHSPNFPDTKGKTAVMGIVKFFEGLELPAGFKKGNKDTYAGDLPSTTDKPDFWDAANSADHNLIFGWNCCVIPATHTLVTSTGDHIFLPIIPADTSRLDYTGKLIQQIQNWLEGYYLNAPQQLINIARQVQNSSSPASLHNSLVNYEKVFAGTTAYNAQMSKVYLLLRVLYKLPTEMNPANARTFGGWIHPDIGSNTSFNMSWPVSVFPLPNGFQINVDNYMGFMGRTYNAAAELDYFNTNFQRRNL